MDGGASVTLELVTLLPPAACGSALSVAVALFSIAATAKIVFNNPAINS